MPRVSATEHSHSHSHSHVVADYMSRHSQVGASNLNITPPFCKRGTRVAVKASGAEWGRTVGVLSDVSRGVVVFWCVPNEAS